MFIITTRLFATNKRSLCVKQINPSTYNYTQTLLIVLTHLTLVPNNDMFEFEVSFMSAVGVVRVIAAVWLGPVHIRIPFTLYIKFVNPYLFVYFQNKSPLYRVATRERVAFVNRVVLYWEGFDTSRHCSDPWLQSVRAENTWAWATLDWWQHVVEQEFPVRGVDFPGCGFRINSDVISSLTFDSTVLVIQCM